MEESKAITNKDKKSVSPTKGKAAVVKDLGPMPKGVSSAYLHFSGEYIPKLRKDDAITPQKELMKLAGASGARCRIKTSSHMKP